LVAQCGPSLAPRSLAPLLSQLRCPWAPSMAMNPGMMNPQVGALLSRHPDELLNILKSTLQQRLEVLQELVDWAAPDLVFGSSRCLTDQRQNGFIKSFNATSGYGFISGPSITEVLGKDLYLSGHQVGSFAVGDEVSFAILLNKGKPQAFDLGPVAAPLLQLMLPQQPAFIGGEPKGYGKGHGKESAAMWGQGGFAMGGGWGPGKGGGMLVGGAKGAIASGQETTKVEMPGVTDRRLKGIVKSTGKDYGFVICSDLVEHFGKEEIYVHATNLEGFQAGDKVNFAVLVNEQLKPQAVRLQSGHQVPGDMGNASKRFRTDAGAGDIGEASKSAVEVPGVTDRRFVGTVKSRGKDYGFVLCEEFAFAYQHGDNVYVHVTSLRDFKPGDQVSFAVLVNEKGKPQAVDLQIA